MRAPLELGALLCDDDWLNLAEAVEQLMGTAGARQLAHADNALVTGIGVIQYGRNWGCSSALVLEAGA